MPVHGNYCIDCIYRCQKLLKKGKPAADGIHLSIRMPKDVVCQEVMPIWWPKIFVNKNLGSNIQPIYAAQVAVYQVA